MRWPEGLHAWNEKIAILGSPAAPGLTAGERRHLRSRVSHASTHATSIAVATTENEFRQAENLVRSAYSGLGYDTGFLGSQSSGQRQDPMRLTVLARIGNQPVGTFTAFLDGPDGMQAELSYPDEIAAIRAMGRPLAELGQFATRPFDSLPMSQRVISALLNAGYLLCASLKQQRLAIVFEVNPHHVNYWRSLGWQVAGPPRHCVRVNAPSVLMILDFDAYTQTLHQCWPLHTHGAGRRYGPWHRIIRYSMLWEDIGGVLARIDASSRMHAESAHRRPATAPAIPLEAPP